jgi:type VI secretion system protein
VTGYGSLFERLGGDADKRAGMTREVSATASVAAHLAKMLSTRAGSVQTLADYGLPDLNDMRLSLHDSLSRARQAIERFIEAYEPRLSNVHVVSMPHEHDQLRLSFSIEGLLDVEGLKCQVRFAARLDGSGQVKVSQVNHVF